MQNVLRKEDFAASSAKIYVTFITKYQVHQLSRSA